MINYAAVPVLLETILLRALLLLCCLWVAVPAQSVTVLASIEPLAMVLRDVLGDEVTVETFLLPSQTPHDSSFTPGQARLVQQADVIVWLGAEAEPALAKLMARARGDQLALLSLPGVYQRELQDSHDHHHEHKHGSALDPHLWLSPDNMRLLAMALVDQAPQLELEPQLLMRRAQQFVAALDEQEQQLRMRLAPLAEHRYMSHHDAWGYFAEAFGLRPVLPISASTDMTPGSRRFVALVQRMEKEGIYCVMAEPESRRALLERLCRGDCKLVEADPLGRGLGPVSYGRLLEDLAERFAHCLAP